jgi:hypothetical protein
MPALTVQAAYKNKLAHNPADRLDGFIEDPTVIVE